jgi:hypothetical protein
LLQPPLLLAEEDELLACELFEQVFKHAISPAHWRWKYQEGPRLGKLQLGIKSDQGQLLAHAGATVFEGQYKDSQGRIQSLPMAQVCDVMVHESARNTVTHQGAYGQVIHALQTQLALAFPGVYAYGFAGIRPYKLGVKMGLYKCHQDCRMGQVPVPEKASSQSIASTLTAFFKSEKLIPLHFNKQDPSEFLKYQSHFDEWSVAWGVNEAPKVLRTAAYLQWRFIQNPSAHYQFWLYKKSGAYLAWLVTRELSPGQLTLVDALMHPKLQSMLEPTLPKILQQNFLKAFQRQPHVESLSSWQIQTEESRQLEPIKACEVKVGNWHICKHPVFWPADTDVF